MKYIFALLYCFICSFTYAQHQYDEQVKQNNISINIGHSQSKEKNLHSKVFRGFNIGALYSHSGIKNNISEYSVGLKISFLNTVYEDFPAALSLLINGNYKYLFPVVSHDKLTYFIGPAGYFQYGTNMYFNWDESHLYFANYIAGGIGNRINYKMGRYNLDFKLDIPIFSGISRPEPNRQYKIDDMTFAGVIKNLTSNPEFALPDKNLNISTGFDLTYSTSNMKIRSFGYSFQYHYMRAANGEPFQNIEQGISYKFLF